MDLFDQPKKMKKVPSPIKHLLAANAKETDVIPKPTWGVANAPPIVGAVHKRPREPNVGSYDPIMCHERFHLVTETSTRNLHLLSRRHLRRHNPHNHRQDRSRLCRVRVLTTVMLPMAIQTRGSV
jgi:hypothetical protein